jgi:hypothetical protein
MGTRVISSRFHYKIKRHSAGEHKLKVKRFKVRLVVQGQHVSKDKGNFIYAFSPVPHLSGVRCCMSMATAMKWKAAGVDLTQGFIQAEMPEDGKAIYISPHPGHVEETDVVYQVCVFPSQCIARHTEELYEVQGNTSTRALHSLSLVETNEASSRELLCATHDLAPFSWTVWPTAQGYFY